MYSSYLIYVLITPFINLFGLCYLSFCLLALLILLFVVVYVVPYSFFNSFHCSCFGSCKYFTFLSVISTLLFMLLLFIRTLLFICCHCFVFISIFIWFKLTHCVPYSSCHRYCYDLALVLLVWPLTLLVYNFPCGDFILN